MSLKDKVAIVTGGEKGIGRGITESYIHAGMKVCMAGISEKHARETMAELESDNLIFIETDVGNEEQVREMTGQVLDEFGRIDAVVCNAGIADPETSPVEELSLEDWEKVIRTNLTGCFLCAKHTFRALRRSKGSMVLITSTRAFQSEPHTMAYSASKGGVFSLTHSLSVSGGPDVRVNSIAPGWIYHGDPDELREIDHEQHPVGRVGRHADIASMARYLISEEAGFITGQNFIVDGGMSTKMIYEH